MKRLRLGLLFVCTMVLHGLLVVGQPIWLSAVGQSLPATPIDQIDQTVPQLIGATANPVIANAQPTTLRPFADVIQGTEKQDGLFTVYYDRAEGHVYLELRPNQLNQNFLSVVTLESGVGELGLYRGMDVNDFLFQFQRVQNTVQIVVPNLYFRTNPGDPQQQSVDRSFSDSVLYSLPILSIHPDRQTLLINLNTALLGDLPNLTARFSWVLGQSYALNPETSYVEAVKAFPLNVELNAVYGFVGGAPNPQQPFLGLDSLPDSRAFNLTVRYSLSQLPQANGFRPRLADDRVGYFVAAYQNFSSRNPTDLFVRYIRRWRLEPSDPTAPLSPPQQPIVFWIENTVPTQYREAIRQGVLLWNTAFEQAGLKDAIEVRQMPDNAAWDPADVRYNTIRWSASFRSSLLGYGPSRFNPLTGQILDADILIDANAVRSLETGTGFLIDDRQSLDLSTLPFCSQGMRTLYWQWLMAQQQAPLSAIQSLPQRLETLRSPQEQEQCFGVESTQQMAMGRLSLATMHNILPSSDAMQRYVSQFLSNLVAHEVGHTLGLRHNFRGSTLLSPDELQNPDVIRAQGMTGSVMDYLPVNLAAEAAQQDDFFPTTLGPYDRWAIEYGYKPIAASTPATETRELERIAQRSAEPGLSYATDEDAYNGVDPEANLWDLSNDALRYSQAQMDIARSIWERLERRYPLPGESYSELRDRFNTVFSHYVGNAINLTRYVGGRVFNRDRRDEPSARQPFELVPIEKQRQALDVLNQYIFADTAFQFSPSLINQLAPSRWNHWGSFPEIFSLDYPIYDNVLGIQSFMLSDLLSSSRLAQLRDAELRGDAGSVLTISELFDSLQAGIWTEILDDRSNPTISSLRRGLQRQYMEILIGMTLRNLTALENATNFTDFILALQTIDAPEDARAVARYQLMQLEEAIGKTLRHHRRDLDTTTTAHLEEARDRIGKVLEAQIQSG